MKRIKLTNGYHLAYETYGVQKGIPVFYFHGFPTSKAEAAIHAKNAEKLGITIYAFDRPGFGDSDFQQHRTFKTWAEDIKECMDKIGLEKVHVVGVSGGGPYAAACAQFIPKKIKTLNIVSGLANLAKVERHDWNWRIKLFIESQKRKPELHELLLQVMANIVTTDKKLAYRIVKTLKFFGDEEDYRVLKKKSEEMSPLIENIHEAFKQGVEGPKKDIQMFMGDWRFDIHNIEVKTFIWHGTCDKVTPKSFVNFWKKIPNAKVFLVDGEGHYLIASKSYEILKNICDNDE